ncbi:hypothetical protein WJX82_002124 [Trebouxia sp. C0006]
MDGNVRGHTTPQDLGARAQLLVEKHAAYIKKVADAKDTLEAHVTEHFRLSGVYWGLTALYLMGKLDIVDGAAIVEWVLKCQHSSGGFGGNQIASYVQSLQQADGSFTGDESGEIDTRFSYVALNCCSLLNRMDAINVPEAVKFLVTCRNFDGGFGCRPGNESHAGQVFTGVAALAIADSLQHVDRDLLCWWLSERQTPSGGLCGRPEKLQDVCYSWWCLSALCILDRLHWIDKGALTQFILFCQDEENGGISDRPEDMVDAFHTFFGIAALSLMGYKGLEPIDPVYALPVKVMQQIRRHQEK